MTQAVPLNQGNTVQTVAASLATLVALTLLGAVLTYWTWAWLAPHPQPRALPVAQRDTAIAPAYRLFGSAARESQPSGLALVLLGVAADSTGKPGYAVIRVGATRIVAAREGDEIEPGIRLAGVQPDQVVLERAGVRETLSFPRNRK